MSSRNRRAQGAQEDNPFVTDEVDETLTFELADRKGYGGPLVGKLDKHINARPVPIFDIHPDPSQPRRAIPFAVRQHWNGDIADLFRVWVDLAEEERGGAMLDLGALLGGSSDSLRSPDPWPIEDALLRIVDLALSIQQEGLTNPITVVQAQHGIYDLETGERRWLAFHLLYMVTGDDQWLKIPARAVERFSVWRQAGENNARADLNAISRARQFAILLIDMLRERGEHFEGFNAFEHEQDFYAQVADGNLYRIPKGSSDMLVSAIGVKNASQLRYLRSLLRMPRAAWMMADDYNIPMKSLREFIAKAGDDEEKLIKLIRTAWVKSNSVSWDTVKEKRKTEKTQPGQPDTDPFSKTNIKRTAFELVSNYENIGRLSHDERRENLTTVRRMIEWARGLEKAIEESLRNSD